MKWILLVIVALVALQSASAFSNFPSYYPYNQYGMESRYYSGPWGERMVYGGYGYFQNPYGYYPYGYRSYGYMYTPTDLRMGSTGRYVTYSGAPWY
jgi:hypothetical protein